MVLTSCLRTLVFVCCLFLVATVFCVALAQEAPPPAAPAAPADQPAPPPSPEAVLKAVNGASQLGYEGEGAKVRVSRQAPAGVVQPGTGVGNRYYASLPLKGRAMHITVDSRPNSATFYVDLNCDNDLTNDAEAGGVKQVNPLKVRFSIPIKIAVVGGELPISLMLDGLIARDGPDVSYYNDTYLQTKVTVEDKQYLCAIIDGNTNGDYTDGAEDFVVIDFDGDGKLRASKDSAELYKLAEPFLVEGKSYYIASISATEGAKAEPSPNPAKPKPYLTPGHPALDLRATTLSGQTFQLSQLKGYVVVVFFGDTEDKSTKYILPALNSYAQTYNKTEPQLYIIAIMMDKTKDTVTQFVKDKQIKVPVVYQGPDGVYSQGYRILETPKSFWLDHDLIIRYTNLYGSRIPPVLQDMIAKAKAAREAAKAPTNGAEQPKPEAEKPQ